MTDYNDYLVSEDYAPRRIACLERDNYTCQLCGRQKPDCGLNVHHIVYDRVGNEDPDDLVTLCRNCHEKLSEAIRLSKTFFDAYTDQYFGEVGEILKNSGDLERVSKNYIENLAKISASALEPLDAAILPEKRVTLVRWFLAQTGNVKDYPYRIRPNNYIEKTSECLYHRITQGLKTRKLERERGSDG